MKNSNELITSIRINTRFDANTIEQDFTGVGMVHDLAKQVINLQEKAVEEALISLGWTPPPNEVADPHNKLEHGVIHHSERMKAIAFSTGNISQTDAKLLEGYARDPRQESWVLEGNYGFILRLYPGFPWTQYEDDLSPEFMQILQLCVKHEIYFVEIDSDARTLRNAKQFDW